jgi:hypothetical protein
VYNKLESASEPPSTAEHVSIGVGIEADPPISTKLGYGDHQITIHATGTSDQVPLEEKFNKLNRKVTKRMRKMKHEMKAIRKHVRKLESQEREPKPWCSKRMLVVGFVLATTFWLNCSYTILTVTLPDIAVQFHSTTDVVEWVLLAPLLINAMLITVCGT